ENDPEIPATLGSGSAAKSRGQRPNLRLRTAITLSGILQTFSVGNIFRAELPPVTPALEPLRRIAAYAVATDDAGRVLLVRASTRSGTPGVWSLPGGAVDHGEDPNHTVVRETAAETGLSVAVTGLRDVLADMRSLPH